MNKKIPMRQCVGCGTMKSKKEMMRVLKTAEEEIILDTTGKRMDAVHIYASQWNALKWHVKTEAWSVRLK